MFAILAALLYFAVVCTLLYCAWLWIPVPPPMAPLKGVFLFILLCCAVWWGFMHGPVHGAFPR